MHNINGETKIFGIIGNPIKHTLSPIMHNAAFEYSNINAVYVPFGLTEVTNIRKILLQLGIQGISVTIPFKETIISHCDHIEHRHTVLGSMNTILVEQSNQTLYGTSTDGYGAVRAIQEYSDVTNKKVLIIGSGGSARAIIHSLYQKNIDYCHIIARNSQKMQQLRQEVDTIFYKKMKLFAWNKNLVDVKNGIEELSQPEQTKEYDIIIQTTPIGMKNYNKDAIIDFPIQKNMLHSHQIAFDIVYNPQDTFFLKMAIEKGCQCIFGKDMLLYQAVKQWELFVEHALSERILAPIQIMRKTLESVLKY